MSARRARALGGAVVLALVAEGVDGDVDVWACLERALVN